MRKSSSDHVTRFAATSHSQLPMRARACASASMRRLRSSSTTSSASGVAGGAISQMFDHLSVVNPRTSVHCGKVPLDPGVLFSLEDRRFILEAIDDRAGAGERFLAMGAGGGDDDTR